MRRLLAPALTAGLAVSLAGSLLGLAGCGGDDSFPPSSRGSDPATASPQPTEPATTLSPSPRRPPRVLGTVARGLEVPWGIGFLPDGSALVTERDSGRVLHVADGTVTPVGRIDETVANGESGLLGLAVSPTYAQDRRVFVYASTDDDNRVLRFTFDGTRIGSPAPVLTGIPRGFIHDGGRLAFGPDGYLYVSTGETGRPELAQRASSPAGKILRITQDGKPAPGNPDPGSPVWSLGHRNVQGLAFDDAGRLWASEFGQNTWDELNLIQKGVNYGWPQVEGKGTADGFRNPQVVWHTDEASPSGLAWTDGHLWLASLRGERLWRVDANGARATAPKDFFVGEHGRMRTVVVAPDGNLWVTTSNRDGRGTPKPGDDRILLVSPGS
ncbi:PQQ-dependent sugar dehydrogenase [Marmoricola sp. RAF53]|uniref:PQQ-dependent sugar dehydrogenase n=1 Tax=Marmoricola sp. RAF53 TaxID=3233059 RepID=UPI003F9A5E78